MAFIRSYSEQGDPRRHTLRAGTLRSRASRSLRIHQAPRTAARRARLAQLTSRRLFAAAGDPFKFRLPKFVRELSLKKVVTAVGKVAKAALPIAAPFIPGVGPFIAPLVGGALAGGGGPDTPAPELVQQPEYQGPPSSVAYTYVVPGVEVSASRYDGTYPGDYDESDYGPDEEDDDEYDDEYDDESYDEEE